MREFLALNEVKRLVETKCDQPVLKDAFLFCVLTGLRWSDIAHLTWEEVKGNSVDGWYLHFKQRKTKLYHVLPITPQAKELLGERLESNLVIFKELIQLQNFDRTMPMGYRGWCREEDHISLCSLHACYPPSITWRGHLYGFKAVRT